MILFNVVLYPSLLQSANIGGWARICKPTKEPIPSLASRYDNPIVELAKATYAGVIDSSESIPGLLQRLQIRALFTCYTERRKTKREVRKGSRE